MKLKLHLLVLLLAAGISSVSAQGQRVAGRVTDSATGEPMIGVSIVVAGSTKGTITDIDGGYEITGITPDAVLNYSYLGYAPQSMAVEGRDLINVALTAEVNVMDELVVVGYSVQRKRDVLGAVANVSNADLVKVPVSSPALALQGRVPGVQVSTSTGAPGAPISVRVRGVGSINSSNDPLYIIDGVQVENGLNAISPNDIEDITVLKDASMTAIYGSRGSNGIVLITTKKGKAGEFRINFSTQTGVQFHGRLTPMANTAQYIDTYNAATRTDNAISAIGQRPLIEGDYLNNLADVDHVKSIFRPALLQSHELSISGGAEKINYSLSGSYFNQDGIIKNSSYEKGSFRANVNSEVKPWLTTGFNIIGSMSKTKSIPSSGDGYGNSEGGSAIRYALFRNPAIPTYDGSGNLVDWPQDYFGEQVYNSFFGDGYNPVGVITMTDRTRKEDAVIASANIGIKLPWNLNLKSTAGVDYNSGEFRLLNYNWGTNDRINNPTSLAVENYKQFTWTSNTVLNFAYDLGRKHSLSGLVGFEAVRSTQQGINSADQNYADNLILIGKGLNEEQRTVSETGINAYTLASFFGSVNYNWDSKYYLSATVRRDGTSRFIGKNRWGTFWSASAGWNIERENFLKDVRFIDVMKLRLGYGTSGNQDVGLYAYSDLISPDRNYPFGGSSNQGYVTTQLGNPNLKWETSQQLNVGLDMAFLRNSLGFSVDYYYKVSRDMLLLAPLPTSAGNVSPAWDNRGSMMNTGIDLELFYRRDFKDGGFDIRLNGGWLKNKVLSLDGGSIYGGRVDQGIYATLTEEGYPVGSFYMLEMEGIFQNELEVMTSAYQGAGIAPGDVKYVNRNGDTVIDENDRVHLGSAIPKFTAGLNLSAYWKGFDLSAFFQGAFGHKIYVQVYQDIEGFYRGFNVTERYAEGYWRGEGTSNTQPRPSWKSKSNNARVSSRFLEDGSYVRLKNLQLGYTIPNSQKIGIDNLRIYLAATNLFTITKYYGMDPEMTVSANSSSEGDRANGIDWGTYPVARSFTLGINLTF